MSIILTRILKPFYYENQKFEEGATVGFNQDDKHNVATLTANKCLEIIPPATPEIIEQKEIQTDKADLQTTVYQLLLQKDRDGATELLTTTLTEETKFYATRFDEKNELYYYEEGIYKNNGKTKIKEFVRQILREAYTEQMANRVIAKIEADNFIEQDEFLKRHYCDKVAVENGILDLTDGLLLPFSPERIFLSKIPIHYNPDAECPGLDEFFGEILATEEDKQMLLQWFGYCLVGGYPIQKIGLFIGEGGNGKGQTLELLRTFLGHKNCVGIPLQKLQESDFKESELFNKLSNIGADISDQPLKETSKIKGLSGGDTINASVKFKNDLTFVNEAKLIFSANKLPKTYDLTPGFFRRWTYLVFPYRFVTKNEYDNAPDHQKKYLKIKKDDIIKTIATPEELAGLLNKAMHALRQLLTEGAFIGSKTSEQTMIWWVRNSDSFLAFCWENIEEHPDAWISKKELRQKYQLYCRKNKLVSEGDKHIKEVLTRQIHAWDNQDGDTGDRVWNGVRWKNEN